MILIHTAGIRNQMIDFLIIPMINLRRSGRDIPSIMRLNNKYQYNH